MLPTSMCPAAQHCPWAPPAAASGRGCTSPTALSGNTLKFFKTAQIPQNTWQELQGLVEWGWSQWQFGKGQGGIERWGDTRVCLGRRNKPAAGWDMEDVNPISGFCES